MKTKRRMLNFNRDMLNDWLNKKAVEQGVKIINELEVADIVYLPDGYKILDTFKAQFALFRIAGAWPTRPLHLTSFQFALIKTLARIRFI